MVSIAGDISGFVTGDPPNLASGDLDAVPNIGGLQIRDPIWSIAGNPALGTASIDVDTGVWTYTVDPLVFDALDDGEIVNDTFTVLLIATIVTGFGPIDASDTQVISITIEGVCFAAGTLIKTERGPVAIEQLDVGDLVKTADHGLQPIRWIESRHISNTTLLRNPGLRPVHIRAGSLGPGSPSRDLIVSQQHRILVSGPRVEMLFGEREVLVAAKHLCAWPGIQIDKEQETVEYYHILLDRHEILVAEDALAESLFLGEEALYSMSSEGLQEFADIFPDNNDPENCSFGTAARRILREYEALAMT